MTPPSRSVAGSTNSLILSGGGWGDASLLLYMIKSSAGTSNSSIFVTYIVALEHGALGIGKAVDHNCNDYDRHVTNSNSKHLAF
jgi:hypothetical protein